MKRKYEYEENTIPEPGIHNDILKKQKSILDINDTFSLDEPAITNNFNKLEPTLNLNIDKLSLNIKSKK